MPESSVQQRLQTTLNYLLYIVRRFLFLTIIFCNAFLVFQVQPILSKELLPVFGGSAAVWSASMFFYQAMLFCGYLYAHGLAKLSLKTQFSIHAALLIIAPVMTFNTSLIAELQGTTPALIVMLNLAQQVGVAFILLSSTSVLLQHWHSITSQSPSSTTTPSLPYHWYALSN